MNKTVIITITKIYGRAISFDGCPVADGCDVSNFSTAPKVGDRYYCTYSELTNKVVSTDKIG
jgi:hypothetical protein